MAGHANAKRPGSMTGAPTKLVWGKLNELASDPYLEPLIAEVPNLRARISTKNGECITVFDWQTAHNEDRVSIGSTMKNKINAELLETGTKKEVRKELLERVHEYNASNEPSAMQVLMEIQLLMTRLNTIEQEKVERRALWLEVLVIILILLEAIFSAVGLLHKM